MHDPEIHDYDPAEAEFANGLPESFRIGDDDQATWAMRKLLAAQSRKDANDRVAERERNRIDSWAESVNARHARDIDYFTGLLVAYASDQRAIEGRKTIDTPYGVVKSRQGQPRISVEDQEAFIAWARVGHDELLSVITRPSLAAIKALAEIESTDTLGVVAVEPTTGEVIPGLAIEPATVSYSVEVSK